MYCFSSSSKFLQIFPTFDITWSIGKNFIYNYNTSNITNKINIKIYIYIIILSDTLYSKFPGYIPNIKTIPNIKKK